MTTDTTQIRQDIERTRNELSDDVDALTYKVSPRRIVGDRTNRVRGAVRNVRDRVMGTAHQAGGVGGTVASTIADKTSATASAVGDMASTAQERVRTQTQGSPLAAGLVAFGAGVVISSLLPPTRREEHLAGQVKEKVAEHAGEIRQQAGEAAREMQEQLREPAQQAVESVKSTAGSAAETVRDESRSAAQSTRKRGRA